MALVGVFTTIAQAHSTRGRRDIRMHYTYEAFLAESADNRFSLAVVFSGIKQESKKVKIQESRNKPGVAQRVPGGVGSQIFMTFGILRW